MNQWDDFAGRLRELREAAGLTQLQLAEQAGLTEQGLGQIERGRRQPTWETVCRLAAALGVSCEAFVRPGGANPASEAQAVLARPTSPNPAGTCGEEPAPKRPGKGKK